MIEIFCGALLGGFLGVLSGFAFIAGVMQHTIKKANKEVVRKAILGDIIIKYGN